MLHIAPEKEKFNQVEDYYYNQRRVWSNGGDRLEIYYTTRFEPARWVISNGTYHLFEDVNSIAYGGVNHSFPGKL